MNKNHVDTVIAEKCKRYDDMLNGQRAALRSQLTKALNSPNLGVKMEAETLIITFNIYHAKYNPNGSN